MIHSGSKVIIAGAMALGVVTLGGCATEKYVNTQVGQVNARVDDVSGKVSDVSARVTDHDTKIATLDKTSRDALDRATAAGKLAEGKFLYSEVLTDDSMKFGPSKASLSPEAQARLDAFVDKLKTDNKNVYVEIQGHTRRNREQGSQLPAGRAAGRGRAPLPQRKGRGAEPHRDHLLRRRRAGPAEQEPRGPAGEPARGADRPDLTG